MQAKDDARHEARRLRADGLVLAEIAARLGVAKSSVSVWVRDVPMPPTAPVWRQGRTVPKPAGAEAVVRLPVWTSGRARRCSRCRHVLPQEAFNRLRQGHQHYCRKCFAEYHQEHHQRQRALTDARTQTRRATARRHILALLRDRPCIDCGEDDPVVLEFDHLRGKQEHLSVMVSRGRSTSDLDEEIAKCEVVCVACHRRRTARRAGWLRAGPRWREHLEHLAPRVRRNVRHVYEHLEDSGCVDCGCRDLTVLDFDHRDGKRFGVVRAAWDGYGLATIDAEIARCDVRCATCHRRRTARGSYYRWQPTPNGGADEREP